MKCPQCGRQTYRAIGGKAICPRCGYGASVQATPSAHTTSALPGQRIVCPYCGTEFLPGDQINQARETISIVGNGVVVGGISGASLQRFSSSIYWNGVERWGTRRFPGSQGQYHRWLNHFYKRQKGRRRPEDGEFLAENIDANWDPYLPDLPETFPASVVGQHEDSDDAKRWAFEQVLMTLCDESLQ